MNTKTNKPKPRIKFIAIACRWFDRVNGNTYHSVRITRCRDGAILACPMTYGYGECYKQTALEAMGKTKWLPVKYRGPATHGSRAFDYERENNYPISWSVSDGLKRDCVANGQ